MIKKLSTLALITSLVACGGSSDGDGKNTANKVTGDLSVTFDAYDDDTIQGKLTSNSTATFAPQNNLAGEFGSFSIEANGQWAYKPNNFDFEQVKQLNSDSIEDKFTVTTSTGDQQQVTVSAPIKYQRLAYAKTMQAPISTTIYDPETDSEYQVRDISAFLNADIVFQATTNSQVYRDYEYESDNNLTKSTRYNSNNEIMQQIAYSYVKDGGEVNTVERHVKNYSTFDSDFLYLRDEIKYLYVWDNQNARYASSTIDFTRKDQFGDLVSQTSSSERFEYNNAGKPSKELTTYQGESEYLDTEYNYSNGLLYKRYRYLNNGSIDFEYSLFYDEFNRAQAYLRHDISRPHRDSIYFYIYHDELQAVVSFSVLIDQFIQGQIVSNVVATVYFYDDAATCGDIDKARAKLATAPITNCRIKTELPSTSDLPTTSELGL
ncbi:VCBS domain-containing protein [Catenovulum sp. SX2]|uniref:VCBS domain-containing protein n=1 Tax=Catenovulum sp. SX2 TaxID=3398614 RepID=UPI003F877EF6